MGLRQDTLADPRQARELDVTIAIGAPADSVLEAFFDRDALARWWRVAHAVTTPRALGVYAVEWAPTEEYDGVLGRLGGVFRGTVMQFDPGRGFFVADAYWLPPSGDPIGPMALEVTCGPDPVHGDKTRLHVRQTGFEESLRWGRYYSRIGAEWSRALASLKAMLETSDPQAAAQT